MIMKELVEKAAQICLQYHAGQVDKQGEPYFMHPFRIMLKCRTDEERIVALLHDIIEDTDYTLAELRVTFGDEIANAIIRISRGCNENYFTYIERLSKNQLAIRVKELDLMDNLDGSRGIISESLRNRYQKALGIIRENKIKLTKELIEKQVKKVEDEMAQ